MNLLEHTERVRRLITTVKQDQAEKIIYPAATALLARIKRRITQEGRNSNGGAIGTYSRKPIYASRQQFVKQGSFAPKGKPNGRDVKVRKTMYLAQGIKELRQLQGLPSDKVNLTYSGDLMAEYQLQRIVERVFLGMSSREAAKKRRYAEARYGPVLTASKDEFLAYKDDVNKRFLDQTISMVVGHV